MTYNKRELVMEHYSNPRNKGEIKGVKPIKILSNQCVDELTLYVEEHEDFIKDIKFEGVGCAVFLASADILINKVKGLPVAFAKDYVKEFEVMINTGKYDINSMEELSIFDDVKKHLNRLSCTMMIVRAFEKV